MKKSFLFTIILSSVISSNAQEITLKGKELFGDLVKYADEENFVSQPSRKERKMAELQ